MRYLVVVIGDGDFEFTDVIFFIFWMQLCMETSKFFSLSFGWRWATKFSVDGREAS